MESEDLFSDLLFFPPPNKMRRTNSLAPLQIKPILPKMTPGLDTALADAFEPLGLNNDFWNAPLSAPVDFSNSTNDFFSTLTPIVPSQNASFWLPSPVTAVSPFFTAQSLLSPIEKSPPFGAFTCPHCPKSFPRKQNLRSHIRCHISERPHVCQECNAAFRRLPDLYRHQRSLHGSERPHVCPGCNKGFARLDTMKRHAVSCLSFK